MPSQSPRGPRTTDRRIVRKKVQLTDGQASRLAAEADASALTESGYVQRLLLDHWQRVDRKRGLPTPAPSFTRNSKLVVHRRGDMRRRVLFADAELEGVRQAAAAAGLTDAQFIHRAVLAAAGVMALPSPKRSLANDKLLAEVQTLAWELSKHGANLNQLAKQANTGMVQVNAQVMHYAITQQHLLYSKAAATLERLLA